MGAALAVVTPGEVTERGESEVIPKLRALLTVVEAGAHPKVRALFETAAERAGEPAAERI